MTGLGSLACWPGHTLTLAHRIETETDAVLLALISAAIRSHGLTTPVAQSLFNNYLACAALELERGQIAAILRRTADAIDGGDHG
jgi:hypothetical protein